MSKNIKNTKAIKAKKTKQEKRADVLAVNKERLENIKADISFQEELLNGKKAYVELNKKHQKLSLELIELKDSYPTVLKTTGRPEFESLQRYHDIMREISKDDFLQNKQKQMEQNIYLSEKDITSSEQALTLFKEELVVASKAVSDMEQAIKSGEE